MAINMYVHVIRLATNYLFVKALEVFYGDNTKGSFSLPPGQS